MTEPKDVADAAGDGAAMPASEPVTLPNGLAVEPLFGRPEEPLPPIEPLDEVPLVEAVDETPAIEPAAGVPLTEPVGEASPSEPAAEMRLAEPAAVPPAEPAAEVPLEEKAEEAPPADPVSAARQAETAAAAPSPAEAAGEILSVDIPSAPLAAHVAATPETVVTVDVPAVVEPQEGPFDLAEPAPQPVENRPTMRNRRLFRRVLLDAAALEVAGAPAKLVDLSMGGFAALGAPELEPRTVAPVSLRLSIDGVDIGARMRARIVYGDGARSGGRFIDLTAGQTAFLRYIVTWRHQAAGALATTTLLDAITRTPPRSPPEEVLPVLESPTRKAPWWSRWLGRLLGPRRGETA